MRTVYLHNLDTILNYQGNNIFLNTRAFLSRSQSTSPAFSLLKLEAKHVTRCVTLTTDFGQYILFFEFSIPLLIGRFISLFRLSTQLYMQDMTWRKKQSKAKNFVFFFSFSGSWLKCKVDLQDKVHLDWVSCDQIVRAEFLLVISLKSRRRYCNYSQIA